MIKRKLSIMLPKKEIDRMKKIKEETGISASKQIEFRLKLVHGKKLTENEKEIIKLINKK